MASGNGFRQLRILILLLILLAVALDAWLSKSRTTDWDETLWVGVYPINGDESAATAKYINALQERDFGAIERFFEREAERLGLSLATPVYVKLGPQVYEFPPPPPTNGNVLATMWWSLKLRYWSYSTRQSYDGPPVNIHVYVQYFDPNEHQRLNHSLGLQKGLVGVVNAFASAAQTARNNVVIAHELLHTVGATDKYHPGSNLPQYPHGFAHPERSPLYPQEMAEIMGGRVPLTATRAETPSSLARCLIGPLTAVEINWQ